MILHFLNFCVWVNNVSKIRFNQNSYINVLMCLIVIHIPNFIFSDTYYIAATGNDTNNGSVSAPWRTVTYAWSNSGGGDTVLIRGGTFVETQIWLAAGRRGAGIENSFWILKNYPGEIPILTDTRIIIDDDYIRLQGLHLTGTSFLQAVSWSGLHEHIELIANDISGSPTVPISFIANKGLIEGNNIHPISATHGIYIMHGNSNIIRNNNVLGVNKYGIHIYDENKYDHPSKITNLLVENNTVTGSQSRSGIIISAGESIDFSIEIKGVLIRNNVITKNAEDGITIRYYGTVRDVDIYNNTIFKNEVYGLRISAQDVDNINVKNNIFSFNDRNINVSTSLDTFVISHNLYWHPSSIGSGLIDSHAVFKDPSFVNAEDGNFHLRDGSPAIDTGVDIGIPYLGLAPDLGAYETGLSSTSDKNSTIKNRAWFNLEQNYPNPFNSLTKIRYSLPSTVDVDLAVFNISGWRIKTLVHEKQIAGQKSVKWNGKDKNGIDVSSGIYFYKLCTDEFLITRKMLIIR